MHTRVHPQAAGNEESADRLRQSVHYTPRFLNVLTFEASRAVQPVLDAIDTLRAMNADKVRSVPATAPTAFVKPRLPLFEDDASIRVAPFDAIEIEPPWMA